MDIEAEEDSSEDESSDEEPVAASAKPAAKPAAMEVDSDEDDSDEDDTSDVKPSVRPGTRLTMQVIPSSLSVPGYASDHARCRNMGHGAAGGKAGASAALKQAGWLQPQSSEPRRVRRCRQAGATRQL